MQSKVLFVCVVLSLLQVFVIKSELVDLAETAINDGRFNTLVAALKAADLVEALKGNNVFTIFAPTDAAFEKLPQDKVTELLEPENKEALTKILTYHAVGGKELTAEDVLEMNPPFQLEMFNGQSTQITKDGDSIMINNATVIEADLKASNGVIHAIDTVLLPDDSN